MDAIASKRRHSNDINDIVCCQKYFLLQINMGTSIHFISLHNTTSKSQYLCLCLGGRSYYQSIIIPLYKRKGSKSECSNYRGITLLSVPEKVFAHVILSRIRPTLLAKRHLKQSGFTPGRSTCDRIVTLNNIVQRRQDYGHPTYAAYVDLRAAFDSLSRSSLWLLLTRLGIPG